MMICSSNNFPTICKPVGRLSEVKPIGIVIAVVLAVVTLGFGLCIIVPAVLGYGLYILVFGIIAALKAYDGERYRYPFCWRLVQ